VLGTPAAAALQQEHEQVMVGRDSPSSFGADHIPAEPPWHGSASSVSCTQQQEATPQQPLASSQQEAEVGSSQQDPQEQLEPQQQQQQQQQEQEQEQGQGSFHPQLPNNGKARGLASLENP
jgi:hypothetical protein